VHFQQTKEFLGLLEECLKKDKCTIRWGPPTWQAFENDEREDPRRFRISLLRGPFRFRSADGQEISCEPEDAARALTALKARVEDLVRKRGGRLGESKEEQGLTILDGNGEVLRELTGQLRGVQVSYVLGDARGEVLAGIDLQEGVYFPGPGAMDPFKGRTGVLAVWFVETVSRQQIARPGQGDTK
jgi:hypothetical protein